jgi:hypothetical protein
MKFMSRAQHIEKLLAESDTLKETLRDCLAYFKDRADAQYFTDRAAAVPNEEMSLQLQIEDALG